MNEVVIPEPQAAKGELCTRCLQPVPYGSGRCACGQPYSSRRYVPLLIGTAGLFALVFVLMLMYYATWRADVLSGDVPVDEAGRAPEIMVDTSKDDGKPTPPPQPEKKPPLNEK